MSTTEPTSPASIAALRRFARRRDNQEHCDLCGTPIPPDHQHLIDPSTRKIVCGCDACSILFSSRENGKFRRIPRDVQFLDDFQITDGQWENLHLPINLAFFFHSTPASRMVAMFPSPAGGTESLLTLDAWDDLAATNPILRQLQPDVEALLVNRTGQARQFVRVPIDECFKLVGLIRANWRGLSGGNEVWELIVKFFQDLKARSPSSGGRDA